MSEKKKILITGSMGFLGSTLIEHLLARADELNIESITGIDNLMFKEDDGLHLLRNPKYNLVIGDVRNKELLIKLVKESNVIFPFCSLVGMPICKKFPMESEEINYGHVKTIVDNMNPGTKVLNSCTNSVYGDSGGEVNEESLKRCISQYAITKFKAETEILQAKGTSLRLATLCGVSAGRNRLDLLVNSTVLKAITDGYILLYQPNAERCYISVNDAARGFIHALENYDIFKGQPFNLGNTSLNMSKINLARKIKEFVPNFVIKVDDYQEDVDKRDYRVSNKKIESTGFSCNDGFDVIIPQVIKAYTVLLNTKNYMLT